MKKIIVGMLVMGISFGLGFARDWLAGAHYRLTFPTADSANCINGTGYLGGGLELRSLMSPMWRPGL